MVGFLNKQRLLKSGLKFLLPTVPHHPALKEPVLLGGLKVSVHPHLLLLEMRLTHGVTLRSSPQL